MLRRKLHESLTVRIFLITLLILLGAGAITFALIAWATPITYTAAASDDLRAQTDLLVERLSVTALEDCAAMEQCSYCGVRFLATAHAWSVEDLHRRPVYRRLLQTGMFQTAVVLQPDQTYTVEELHTG